MEKTEFDAYTAQQAEAQEHNNEIQRTRVGGLGGSDADMLMRIGRNGMGALTATDMKRLAVMMGVAEQEQWGGNVYTNAGHMFEEFAEHNLPFSGLKWQREEYLETALAENFKTFAHADFTVRGIKKEEFNVIECKFVQKPTAKVIDEYMAQLQWYYIQGAQVVFLYHGQGDVEPFMVAEAEVVPIERDEDVIADILDGVDILDNAISDGWKPVVMEKMHINDAAETVQRAFIDLQYCARMKAEIAEKEDAAKAVIASYMQDFACSNIHDDLGNTCTITKASTSRTFDSAKLLKAHPEFNTDEYYKTTARKASLTFKPAKADKE